MFFIIRVFIFIFFFVLSSAVSYAEQNLKFVNVDELIKKTILGKSMINKINKLDQSNINQLKLFEDELKKKENNIKLKKNIISEEEFNKELEALKIKLNSFNEEKKKMVDNLNNTKNEELKTFFEKINPIIQNYMKNNSIEIVLNSKNVFMSSKNSDITNKLIEEINNYK